MRQPRKILYISYKSIKYLNRPFLFALAARKLGHQFYFTTYRDIMTQLHLWHVIAGLDKISFLRPVVWSLEGTISAFFSSQFNTVFLLNPMGAIELRNKLYKDTIIIDYMDFIVKKDNRLLPYHYLNLKVADGLIFWSKAVMEKMKPYFSNKPVLYLPFGVSLSLFNPIKFGEQAFLNKYSISRNRLRLLYSGGVWRGLNGEDYQGVDKLPHLVRTLKKVAGRKFLLVLNSPFDSKLYRNFKQTDTLNQVLWIPPTPLSSPLRQSMFRAADICILPASRYPPVYYAERMKMFEYMASGRAIIAEDTPGVRGVLRDGYNAIISRLDDLEELSQKALTLMENRELREYLGEKAFRDLVSNYEWRVLVQKLVFELFNLK